MTYYQWRAPPVNRALVMQSPYILPSACSLNCPSMSFEAWLNLDWVFTLSDVEQPLGISGLP